MTRILKLRILKLRLPLASAVLCALAVLSHARAQQAAAAKPSEMTVDSILAALDANIANYTRSIPSFLCNERIVSDMDPAPTPSGFLRTTTEAVFSVVRIAGPNGQPTLQGSHNVKTINGKAPNPNAADQAPARNDPNAVSGIYGMGLGLVSTSAKACFAYHLHPVRKATDKIVIDFENLPASEHPAPCPFGDKTSGQATIDPATMRVVRVQVKMRDHQTSSGQRQNWDWTIDYAPVALGDKTFWMPTQIDSVAAPTTATAGASSESGGSSGGSSKRGGGGSSGSAQGSAFVTYTLGAKYSGYHLLEVTSSAAPAAGTPASASPSAPSAQNH